MLRKVEMDAKDDEDGDLVIQIPLEINTSRINDLGLFDRKSSQPAPSKPFQHDANQLLTQGAFLGSMLQSRLKLVRFGQYSGSPACLVVLSIDFKPKSYTGVLRFRDAIVEVQVQPGIGDEGAENTGNAYERHDDGKKEPRIVTWHPGYLEGPAKSTLESFNISLDTSTIPPAFGAPAVGPSFGHSMSRERVKRRIIHGTIEDEKQRVLEWKLEENKSAGDGIPPACNFAFVVKVDKKEGFHVKLGIRAVTVAALPVIGKNTGAIHFAPGKLVNSLVADANMMAAWASAVNNHVSTEENKEIDLTKVDLAMLTQAEEMMKKT